MSGIWILPLSIWIISFQFSHSSFLIRVFSFGFSHSSSLVRFFPFEFFYSGFLIWILGFQIRFYFRPFFLFFFLFLFFLFFLFVGKTGRPKPKTVWEKKNQKQHPLPETRILKTDDFFWCYSLFCVPSIVKLHAVVLQQIAVPPPPPPSLSKTACSEKQGLSKGGGKSCTAGKGRKDVATGHGASRVSSRVAAVNSSHSIWGAIDKAVLHSNGRSYYEA